MAQRGELGALAANCAGPEGVKGMATVRARYEKGVLTPLEPLDLEEGKGSGGFG